MMTIDKTIEAIDELPDQPMIRCRDCADDGPFCPNRGMPCSLTTDELKALAAELKELREFVGAMCRVAIEEWHGHWVLEKFTFFNGDYSEPVATGTDPFDAWRKMNAGEVKAELEGE